ncbi:S-layer homology domain-containing protein [Exiguobacterium sp. s161]|uniref:S-layer homology domain-containing protein n=1 Tax=Exiguobacterium sp. s161 TaxID=2751191 RepID=UPI001BE8108B|nr:S-layer homology domain-containing protein [Exiguobacterium sp. s161]
MKNKPAFKASLAAVLAFSALQPAMVAGASQKITDVKKGTKYYEGVQFLLKNKAIQGNHFYPDRYLTQEAAVQMLSKIWKVKAAKPQKGVFTNIPKTSKLYPLLHGMVARGILEKSKTFDKKQLVQRSELLEWSQRAFRLKPTNVQPYQDVSITSSTGKAVSSLSTFSLLHHIYPGTQLKPGQAVKRGEFAQ